MEKSPQDLPDNLHRIEDDISDGWLEDYVGAGITEIEEFLRDDAKKQATHAAFEAFLAERDGQTDQE